MIWPFWPTGYRFDTIKWNGCHDPDDIFKRFFLNENWCILIKISLKYVSQGPITNIQQWFI